MCGLAAVAAIVTAPPIRLASQFLALDQYHDIVQEYRLGHVEAAARDVRASNVHQIDTAIADLSRGIETGILTPPWSPIDVQAAIVMHTDLAIRGIWDASMWRSRNLDLGRLLVAATSRRLDVVGAEPILATTFLRRWHLVMEWQAHGILELDTVADEVDVLRHRFSANAEILLTAGSLSETLAWPGLNESLPRPLPRQLARRDRHALLKEAEEDFRRAVDLVPECDEARLRLGRLLYDQGKYEGSLGALTATVTSSHDPWVLYLGHLFAGAACDRLSRVADAATHYRIAVEADPRAQSGALALSFARRRTGDLAGARQALTGVMNSDSAAGDDPWWEYYFGQWRHLPDALNAMRQEVAR